MTVAIEERVEVLEGKVEKLGVLSEFRREVNGKLDEFGKIQGKQAQTLDIHTGKLDVLNRTVDGFRLELFVARNDRTEFKNEVSGKLERLDNSVAQLHHQVIGDDGLLVAVSRDVFELRDDVNVLNVKVDKLQVDVTELKADVTQLKADVSELKTDVTQLKADVSELKTDVAGLKADLSEFKTEMVGFKNEVRGTLAEILDRLPAKAA